MSVYFPGTCKCSITICHSDGGLLLFYIRPLLAVLDKFCYNQGQICFKKVLSFELSEPCMGCWFQLLFLIRALRNTVAPDRLVHLEEVGKAKKLWSPSVAAMHHWGHIFWPHFTDDQIRELVFAKLEAQSLLRPHQGYSECWSMSRKSALAGQEWGGVSLQGRWGLNEGGRVQGGAATPSGSRKWAVIIQRLTKKKRSSA